MFHPTSRSAKTSWGAAVFLVLLLPIAPGCANRNDAASNADPAREREMMLSSRPATPPAPTIAQLRRERDEIAGNKNLPDATKTALLGNIDQ